MHQDMILQKEILDRVSYTPLSKKKLNKMVKYIYIFFESSQREDSKYIIIFHGNKPFKSYETFSLIKKRLLSKSFITFERFIAVKKYRYI